MEKVSYQLLGQNGSIDLSSVLGSKTFGSTTANYPNQPVAIRPLNGASVTLTVVDGKSDNNLVTSIGVGGELLGSFSTISVTAGAARCYYA